MKRLLAIPLCLLLFTSCNDFGFKTESVPDAGWADDVDLETISFGEHAYQTTGDLADFSLGTTAANGTYTLTNQGDKNSPSVSAQKKYAKKIIRTANMRAEIEDYHQFRSNLAQAVHAAEGFVSNENENSLKHSIEGEITIKVPAANFDALVSGISGLAPKWNKKDITSRDVSDEYYDLETRIETKEEMEKQYLEILKKAKTIEEILQVQGQLRVIREEIESSKGRLKFLASQVGMSTIHISVFQKIEVEEPEIITAGFFSKAGDRFGEGWEDMQRFFLGMIEAWPTLLILGLIVFGFYKGVKRLVRRKPSAA